MGAGRPSESGRQPTEKRESRVESQDEELASRLAGEAGRLLMELRSGFSGDRTSLAKAGDRRSHEHLVAEISRQRPADAIVSEEDEELQRPWPRPARQWVIDPLDGTREYSEMRSDFAVHVALVVDGTAQIGAVALPGEDLVLASGGAARAALSERPEGPVRILVEPDTSARRGQGCGGDALGRTRPDGFGRCQVDGRGQRCW